MYCFSVLSPPPLHLSPCYYYYYYYYWLYCLWNCPKWLLPVFKPCLCSSFEHWEVSGDDIKVKSEKSSGESFWKRMDSILFWNHFIFERQRDRQGELSPIGSLPKCLHQPRARNSTGISHLSTGALNTWASPQAPRRCICEKLESGVEPGLECRHFSVVCDVLTNICPARPNTRPHFVFNWCIRIAHIYATPYGIKIHVRIVQCSVRVNPSPQTFIICLWWKLSKSCLLSFAFKLNICSILLSS